MESELLEKLLKLSEENGILKKENEYLKEKNELLICAINNSDSSMDICDIWNMFK